MLNAMIECFDQMDMPVQGAARARGGPIDSRHARTRLTLPALRVSFQNFSEGNLPPASATAYLGG